MGERRSQRKIGHENVWCCHWANSDREQKKVSSRLMWRKVGLGRDACGWVQMLVDACGSSSGRNVEEREPLWIWLGECVGSLGGQYSVVVIWELGAGVETCWGRDW